MGPPRIGGHKNMDLKNEINPPIFDKSHFWVIFDIFRYITIYFDILFIFSEGEFLMILELKFLKIFQILTESHFDSFYTCFLEKKCLSWSLGV